MGLISEILGGLRANGKPARRTIAEVEKALAKLAAERTAAREAVAKAMRKRDELLLVDGSDALIVKTDTDADRHRLTLERIERAEPVLIQELQELRTEQKRQKWRDLRARYDAAAHDYAAALRAAIDKQGVMLTLNDEARSSGFEHEVAAIFVAPARLLTAEAVNTFALELDHRRDAAAEAAMHAPPAPPAIPAKATPKAPPPKAVAPAPVRPKARERIVQPAGEGEVGLVVLRNGFEVRGEQFATGDVIAMAQADAERALRSGSVDLHRGDAA